MSLKGRCACGDIRYRLTAAPMIVHACHCRDCQRLSGSAFAINLWIERKFVESSGGEPTSYPVPPGSSGQPHDVILCGKCGTRLWNKYHAAPGDTVLLCAGTLDDPAAVTPDVHIFTRSKQPWVQLPPGVPAVEVYYDMQELWPPESLARRKALGTR